MCRRREIGLRDGVADGLRGSEVDSDEEEAFGVDMVGRVDGGLEI